MKNNFITIIASAFRRSAVYNVFNARDELGKGRLCMLLVSIFGGLAGQLSGGFFYTGFLLGYGINIVNIAIITFIPTICSLLSVFSPFILERFRKRRLVLAASRAFSYLISIGGVTLLPVIVQDENSRLLGFIIIIILSNSVNALFSSGYSAWQMNFLPEHIRADFYNTSGAISSCFTSFIVLVVSVLTDRLAGSEKQLELIILFRYIALLIALIDVVIISLPKEFPYGRTSEKPRLTDIFTLPVRNRAFLLSILIICAYNFSFNLPNATINTYLMGDIGVGYTFMNAINAVYFLFFIFVGPIWKRIISKKYWFRALALAVAIQGLTYFPYAFVTHENFGWLLLGVRLLQHICGPATAATLSSIPYINLPDTDRTNYFCFYGIISGISSFTSMILATVFTKLIGDRIVYIFGFAMKSTPLLLLISAVLQLLTAVLIILLINKVTPSGMLGTYGSRKLRAQSVKR